MLKIIKNTALALSLLGSSIFPMQHAVRALVRSGVLKSGSRIVRAQSVHRNRASFFDWAGSGHLPTQTIDSHAYDNNAHAHKPTAHEMNTGTIFTHEDRSGSHFHQNYDTQFTDHGGILDTADVTQQFSDLVAQSPSLVQEQAALFLADVEAMSYSQALGEKSKLAMELATSKHELSNIIAQNLNVHEVLYAADPHKALIEHGKNLDQSQQSKLYEDVLHAQELKNHIQATDLSIKICDEISAKVDQATITFEQQLQDISADTIEKEIMLDLAKNKEQIQNEIAQKEHLLAHQYAKLEDTNHQLQPFKEGSRLAKVKGWLWSECSQHSLIDQREHILTHINNTKAQLHSLYDQNKMCDAQFTCAQKMAAKPHAQHEQSHHLANNLINRAAQEKLNINWDAIPKELGLDAIFTTTQELAQAAQAAHENGNTKGSVILADFGNAMLDFVSTAHQIDNKQYSIEQTKDATPIGQIAYEKMSGVLQSLQNYTLSPNAQSYLATACLVIPQCQGIGVTLHGLNYLGRLMMAEIAGTVGLVTVEMAEIKTICGVTMSAEMAHIVQQAIDQGRLPAVQEAIKDFIQAFEAPFLSGCKEAVLNLEQGLPAIEGATAEAGLSDIAKPLDYAHSVIQYEQLKSALTEEQFTSIIKCTKHGLERLIERDFEPLEIYDLIAKPDILKIQNDGAKIFIKTVADNKFNLMVYNETTEELVTTLRHVSKNSITNLGKNYGWNL